MNVAVVGTFPPFRGGISQFNYALVRTLSAGHSVEAFNFTTQYPRLFFPGKTQMETSSSAQSFDSERVLSTVNPFTWVQTANRILLQGPDLVVFKYWMPFFAPSFGQVVRRVKRKMDTKVLVICDNIVPHEQRPLDLKLTRYFFDKVDRFVVMSKVVEHDLLALYPHAVYRYSPHPVYDIFGAPLSKERARKSLGLEKEKIILYFGLIRQYKGLDILIRAARILKKSLHDFRILAVGECYDNLADYERLIVNLDVADVVDLRPRFIPDDEVRLYFSAADVIALPYRAATQSGIVPIAYHFNRPVVVSNVGGLPEIVSDNEVGFVVPPNPESIAAAIERFYSEGREGAFSKNIETFKEKFSWSRFVQTVEDLATTEG